MPEMLLLTRLHVCDHSHVVEWSSEKATPAGGPAGISHGSRMAGVSTQASAALCSIPDLPHIETPHQSKQRQNTFKCTTVGTTQVLKHLIETETKFYLTHLDKFLPLVLPGKKIEKIKEMMKVLEEECKNVSSILESPSCDNEVL